MNLPKFLGYLLDVENNEIKLSLRFNIASLLVALEEKAGNSNIKLVETFIGDVTRKYKLQLEENWNLESQTAKE